MAIAILLAAAFAILVILRAVAFIGRDGVVHYPVRSMRRLTGASRVRKERPSPLRRASRKRLEFVD